MTRETTTFPVDPLKIAPELRAQVAEDCDRFGRLRHKRDEARRLKDSPDAVCRATVIGIDPLADGDELVRFRCATVGETAAMVASLILRGFPYVHVDNEPVLEARRDTSSTAL